MTHAAVVRCPVGAFAAWLAKTSPQMLRRGLRANLAHRCARGTTIFIVKVLILGGSVFLGRHLVAAALARGHDVTTFNRGKSARGVVPDVEELYGDRDGDLAPLRRRSWDAVLDTSGYVPRVVRKSAEALRGAGHYTFVSSLSVYADFAPNGDESRPIARLDDPGSEDVQRSYGALKAACEGVVEELFPGRALHARAGLLVGPFDTINRFPYWIRRIPEGGELLCPGSPDDPLQLIDARDLAEWLVRQAEQGTAGAFNVTGEQTPFGAVIDTIVRATGASVRQTWVAHPFLERHDVVPGDGVPFWMPPVARGFMQRNIDKALAHGLRFRPLEETAGDTHAWIQREGFIEGRTAGVTIESGLSRQRERELLAAWHDEDEARV